MTAAPIPADESARLRSLRALGVLDTQAEEEFDALVKVAALVCGVPVSLMSLVDAERQWFKANVGLPGTSETPRDIAFCAHAILGDDILEVRDTTLDPRFADNPLVTAAPDIRFYAGAPLVLTDGSHVGTLCVIDRQPRQLDAHQREVLRHLAVAAGHALEGRRALLAERRLHDAEARTASLLRHSVDAIIAISLDGSVTHWNDAATRQYGYAREEMVGRSIHAVLSGAHAPDADDIMSRLRVAPEGSTYESIRAHRDTTLIPVSVSVAPVLGQDGKLVGATLVDRDLRERVQIAQGLARSEARFRALSDASPLGIFATDAHGAWTYTNNRWQQIHQRTSVQTLGSNWLDAIHPEDREHVEEKWRRAVQQQTEFDADYRAVVGDGGVRYVHARARPIDGDAEGFVGSAEDVTERRAALDRLAASEERTRRQYESTPALLHSVDAKGCLVAVSDRWLARLGYSRDEVTGRYIADFMTAESREYSRSVAQPALLANGTCDEVGLQMVAKSGDVIDVLLSAILSRDAAGKVLRSTASIEDVTLRRRVEKALHEERERLANIIEGTQAGTWEWNVRTGEARFNEQWARMLGHMLDELAPLSIMTWLDRAHPDDLVLSNEALERHFKGQESAYECEMRFRHSDGHWVWFLGRGRVMSWTQDGGPEWMYGIHTDITPRVLQTEALKRSAALQERTGRLAQVGGWEMDLVTGRTIWSTETQRILGIGAALNSFSDDALEFFTLSEAIDLFASEARPVLRAAMDNSMATGQGWDLELPLDRAGGRRIWVHAVGSIEFAHGKPTRVTGAMQDVTEHVEQRLALEDARYRNALATDSGGIGIWDYDLITGELVWDAQMRRLYGLAPDQGVVGYDTWRAHLHPDDREAACNAVSESIRDVRPYDGEFRIVRADGRLAHLRAAAGVICARDGRPIRMIGVNWDVTLQRVLANALLEQHELLRVTLQSIGDAVITTDAHGVVSWLNPVAERMTGWSSAEAKGRPIDQVFHIVNEETRLPALSPVTHCLTQGTFAGLADRTILLSRNGPEFGIEDSAAPIRNERGDVLGVVLVFHDVTEQRRLSGEMHYRATHDTLTGLVNRAEFELRLRRLLEKASEERSGHALMYIDLDQFKLVNDACGHSAGDQLLKQITKLLVDTIRSRDTLARVGGDEFAVLMEYCSVEQAQRVAQQICDRMEEFRFLNDGRRFRLGTSIGLVPLDQRWKSTAPLLQAADAACLAAKEAGRNRVHVWYETDEAFRGRTVETEWATRIEQALHEDRFVLFAQRIDSLGVAAPGIHAEVLVRMVEPDGSLVQPGAFLPAAERFHLATRIDRWVQRHAMEWLQALPQSEAVGTLCINLSGQSIGDRAFHRHTMEMLREAGPDISRRLCFEITETAAITNLADAEAFIGQVRALGVRIALDDFGAGASSFGYLKMLSVDFLKIDGGFITDLIDDPLDDAAVRCFADVARVVGVKTVAEFIDRPELVVRLREIGIDYGQGFHLHRPAAITELLASTTTLVQ